MDDIDLDVVRLVQQLRSHGIRFGFISDLKGMESGAGDKGKAAMLARILDGVLRTNGAAPDFWMAWPQTIDREMTAQSEPTVPPGFDQMISCALAWYGSRKGTCVFVGNSRAGISAATRLGVVPVDLSNYVGFGSLRADQLKEIGEKRNEAAEAILEQIIVLTRRQSGF